MTALKHKKRKFWPCWKSTVASFDLMVLFDLCKYLLKGQEESPKSGAHQPDMEQDNNDHSIHSLEAAGYFLSKQQTETSTWESCHQSFHWERCVTLSCSAGWEWRWSVDQGLGEGDRALHNKSIPPAPAWLVQVKALKSRLLLMLLQWRNFNQQNKLLRRKCRDCFPLSFLYETHQCWYGVF